MKTRKLIAIAGLVVLGAAPLAAQAHGAQKATNACVQAFVDTYLPKDRTVTVRKPLVSSSYSMYASRITIDLFAHAGGEQLVTARCVASTSGKVLALEGPPSTRQGAELGARLK